MKCQALKILLRNFVYVFLVLVTENYLFGARALGSKDFLLYATYRKHLSTQRHLSCHGNARTHLAARKHRSERRGYCDACRRSILGHSALRHVDMHILGRKDFGLYANLVGMSLQILKSYLGRFLHHVAEIACQSQFLAFSRHQ